MLKPASALIFALLAGVAHAQVTDDFNRADAGDLGANWTDLAGAGLQVGTNRARTAGASGNNDGSHHNTTMASDDHYAEATVFRPALTGTIYWSLGILGNTQTGASRDLVNCSHGSAGDWYITEVTNGSGSDTDMGTQAIVDGDRMRCEADSGTVRYYLNDVELGSAATSFAGTTVSLIIFNGASEIAGFDDFEADDLGGGGGSAVPAILQQHY